MKANLINGAEASVSSLFKNKTNNSLVGNSNGFSSTLEKVESKIEKKPVQDTKEALNKKTNEVEDKTSKKVEKKEPEKEEVKETKKTVTSLDEMMALLQSLMNNTDDEELKAEITKFLNKVEDKLEIETIDLMNSTDGKQLLEGLGIDLENVDGKEISPELLSDKLKELVKKTEAKEEDTVDVKVSDNEMVVKVEKDLPDHVKMDVVDKPNLDQKVNPEVEDNVEVAEVSTKSIRQLGRELEGEADVEVEVETTDSEDNFIPILKDRVNFNVVKDVKVEKPQEVDQKQVIDQIIDRVKVDFTDNKNQIKLSLKPQTLGNMTMDIQLDKGDVVAKILVDNHRTKEIIESNLVQLKDGLRENGMNIKTVEVEVGNNADFMGNQEKKFNFNQNNNKRFKNSNRIKMNNNYEDSIVVESVANPNNPYEEDGFDIMA